MLYHFFPTCEARVIRFYVSSTPPSSSFLFLPPPPDLNCKLEIAVVPARPAGPEQHAGPEQQAPDHIGPCWTCTASPDQSGPRPEQLFLGIQKGR